MAIKLGIRCITIRSARFKRNHNLNSLSYWSIPTGSARGSLNMRNSNYRFWRWGIRHYNARTGLIDRTHWADRSVLTRRRWWCLSREIIQRHDKLMINHVCTRCINRWGLRCHRFRTRCNITTLLYSFTKTLLSTIFCIFSIIDKWKLSITIVRSLTVTKEDGGNDVLTLVGTSGGGVSKVTSLIFFTLPSRFFLKCDK
jgi:hypothetical protein